MAILRDEDKQAVQERLAGMKDSVKMVFFKKEEGCQFCKETEQLFTEVAETSELLSVEIYDLESDAELAVSYGIDKAPGMVMLGADNVNCGIRYYGIPSGYEFASLLEDILMVSANDSGLSDQTKEMLKSIEGKVHMQVFVTPTCPYCPGAVRLAHQMAFESDKIVADMVEAQEFMELSQKYNVMGVPRTIINEEHSLEGMMPEDAVLQEVLKAL